LGDYDYNVTNENTGKITQGYLAPFLRLSYSHRERPPLIAETIKERREITNRPMGLA